MKLFHLVSAALVDKILQEGLSYGAKGDFSQEEIVAQANDYLDEQCPEHLKAKGLSRNKCVYLYLAHDDKIHDIEDGSVRKLQSWARDQSQGVLAVDINTAIAFVSDLDAFDAVADAIASSASPARCQSLAKLYWQRVVSLQDAVKYYQSKDDDEAVACEEPLCLPEHFDRAEILVTRSIAPESIALLKD